MAEPNAEYVPVRSCCGQRHMSVQCPDGKVRCCLCFDRFDVADLNVIADGRPEDVCKPCAAADALAAARSAQIDGSGA